MAVQYSLSADFFMNSVAPSVPADLTSTVSTNIFLTARAKVFPGFHIHEGVMVRVSGKGTAQVLGPFYVKVQLTEDGFVATSDISDVYELGETVGQAVTNYLYSLVDELIWFQEHKESLSTPMLKDFAKLHHHLGLV